MPTSTIRRPAPHSDDDLHLFESGVPRAVLAAGPDLDYLTVGLDEMFMKGALSADYAGDIPRLWAVAADGVEQYISRLPGCPADLDLRGEVEQHKAEEQAIVEELGQEVAEVRDLMQLLDAPPAAAAPAPAPMAPTSFSLPTEEFLPPPMARRRKGAGSPGDAQAADISARIDELMARLDRAEKRGDHDAADGYAREAASLRARLSEIRKPKVAHDPGAEPAPDETRVARPAKADPRVVATLLKRLKASAASTSLVENQRKLLAEAVGHLSQAATGLGVMARNDPPWAGEGGVWQAENELRGIIAGIDDLRGVAGLDGGALQAARASIVSALQVGEERDRVSRGIPTPQRRVAHGQDMPVPGAAPVAPAQGGKLKGLVNTLQQTLAAILAATTPDQRMAVGEVLKGAANSLGVTLGRRRVTAEGEMPEDPNAQMAGGAEDPNAGGAPPPPPPPEEPPPPEMPPPTEGRRRRRVQAHDAAAPVPPSANTMVLPRGGRNPSSPTDRPAPAAPRFMTWLQGLGQVVQRLKAMTVRYSKAPEGTGIDWSSVAKAQGLLESSVTPEAWGQLRTTQRDETTKTESQPGSDEFVYDGKTQVDVPSKWLPPLAGPQTMVARRRLARGEDPDEISFNVKQMVVNLADLVSKAQGLEVNTGNLESAKEMLEAATAVRPATARRRKVAGEIEVEREMAQGRASDERRDALVDYFRRYGADGTDDSTSWSVITSDDLAGIAEMAHLQLEDLGLKAGDRVMFSAGDNGEMGRFQSVIRSGQTVVDQNGTLVVTASRRFPFKPQDPGDVPDCPSCRGDDPNCETCEGQGVISREDYDREMRRLRDEEAEHMAMRRVAAFRDEDEDDDHPELALDDAPPDNDISAPMDDDMDFFAVDNAPIEVMAPDTLMLGMEPEVDPLADLLSFLPQEEQEENLEERIDGHREEGDRLQRMIEDRAERAADMVQRFLGDAR